MAATMAEGGAVPRTWISCVEREAETERMPGRACSEVVIESMHESQVSGTAKVVCEMCVLAGCEMGAWRVLVYLEGVDGHCDGGVLTD